MNSFLWWNRVAKIESVPRRVSFRQLKLTRLASLCAMLVALVCGAGNAAAQLIEFDGTQRPVALGFYEPEGVAVDQYGNLFVADADTFKISEILAENGRIPSNPTIRVLYRDNSNPEKITVDRNGNVFFTDYNDMSPPAGQTVKEILAVNGSIPASPTVVQLGSGFSFLNGISTDANGNVFISEYYQSSIYEMLAVNGSVPSSPTILRLSSSFTNPEGMAVDALGDVYVADSGDHAVKEMLAVNGSIPASPTIVTLAANYCSPDGVSLDTQGNLYFSDYCNAAIYEILAVNGSIPASPAIQKVDSGPGLGGVTDVAVDANENIYAGGVYSGTQIPQVYPSDFGLISVGATTSATPLLFTIIGPVTLGSISVVTQGAEALDFANASTGTCTAGAYYGAGYSVCTVNVTFTPKFAGARTGSVLLKDTNGNVIATGYLHGTGVAPQVNFNPPAQSTVVSNVPGSGVALDGSGNIYIASTTQNQILKETVSAGSFIQSVLPTSSLNGPQGIAVDSGGSIYIADSGNGRVLKETPSVTGYTETTVGSSIPTPVAVAVDESGVVYIITGSGLVYVEAPVYQSYNNSSFIYPGLSSASGIAVDAAGNVYAVATASSSIVKEAPTQNGYVASSIPLPSGGAPAGISVDGFGNLYVSYTGSNGVGQVVKETPTAGGYVQSTIPAAGLNQPDGVAAGPTGNVFIADLGNSRVVEESFANPPSLTFANTPFGSTSADSPQTVTLENIGNAALSFPIPASGNNPSIAANFTLDDNAPSACAVIGSGSPEPGTLASGSSCALAIGFSPTTVGSLGGSLVLTDNNLNARGPGYVSQSITLSGTATQATPTITWAAPAPITYGTALSGAQLDATASVPGTFSYSPAAGTVLRAGTQTLKVTFTPTDTTDYTTANASVQLTVNKATPVITWPTPAPIIHGMALSSTQLNATASVPGSFVYNPAAGTIPPAGTDTLTTSFTPTDSTDYTAATASVTITVNNPSFTLSASPASVSIKQGNNAKSTISVTAVAGFSGKVTLAASGLPKGVTARFSPNPATTASALTLTVSNSATAGTSSVKVTGTSGSLVQTTTIALTVVRK